MRVDVDVGYIFHGQGLKGDSFLFLIGYFLVTVQSILGFDTPTNHYSASGGHLTGEGAERLHFLLIDIVSVCRLKVKWVDERIKWGYTGIVAVCVVALNLRQTKLLWLIASRVKYLDVASNWSDPFNVQF